MQETYTHMGRFARFVAVVLGVGQLHQRWRGEARQVQMWGGGRR